MRYLIVLAVVTVAGCMSPEQRAAHESAARAEFTARYLQANSPAGQADANCRTTVQFALAGLPRTSFLDLERDARANQMHASCMDYWRRTGQMP